MLVKAPRAYFNFKIKDSVGAVSFPSKNWVAAQKAAIKTKAPKAFSSGGRWLA